MSHDCLRQCCRTNRIIKRDIELKGKRREKEGREKNADLLIK